jgi:hypothetical protein
MDSDKQYALKIKRRYEEVCDKLEVLNVEAFELEQEIMRLGLIDLKKKVV